MATPHETGAPLEPSAATDGETSVADDAARLKCGGSADQASFSTIDTSGAHASPASASSPCASPDPQLSIPESLQDDQNCSEGASEGKMQDRGYGSGNTRGVAAIYQPTTPCRSRRIPPTSSSDGGLCGEAGSRAELRCDEDVLHNCIGVVGEGQEARTSERSLQDIRVDPLCRSQQERLPRKTQNAPVRSYAMSLDDPVGGMPTRQGELMIYDPNPRSFKPWSVLLFANGFYAAGGALRSFAWSPFSVLNEESIEGAPPSYRSFSLSILAHDMGFVFATRGSDADAKRRRWVDDMAETLRSYTKSLFPAFSLRVDPVEDKPCTARRIVAGYLLLSEPDGAASVPYCELQAHFNGTGLLAMYESDRCDRQVTTLRIGGSTVLECSQGVDCSLFTVGHLRFCARTAQERHLWWRAISNVQVHVYNGAPDPTREDLLNFRKAVLERVVALEVNEGCERMKVIGGPGPALPEVSPQPRPAVPGRHVEAEPSPGAEPPIALVPSSYQRRENSGASLSSSSSPHPTAAAGDIGVTPSSLVEDEAVYSKPLPSSPGPGLPEWLVPCPDALSRMTGDTLDEALKRIDEGSLSI